MSSFTFTETVRVAHTGVGRGADLLRAVAALPQVEVVAVCDGDAEALRAAARLAPSAATHHRFSEVLARDDVEAVVVTTEPGRRGAHVEAALEAGCHVLAASPLAQAPAQAAALVAAAAERERRLMADHRLRYHPAVQDVEARLARGELGALRLVRAEHAGHRPAEALLADDLAVALALAPPPLAVAAWGSADEELAVTVACADGVLLQLSASRLEVRPSQRLHLSGTRATAVVDRRRPGAPVRLYRAADGAPDSARRPIDRSTPHVAPGEPVRDVAQELVQAVQQHRAPRTDGAADLAVVRVLDGVRRSLAGGNGRVELGAA